MLPPNLVAKKKIINIFKNCNPLIDHCVQIYGLDSYFYEQYAEEIKIGDDNGQYMLFKIDIYLDDYSLLVDIDENYENKDLIFEIKKQSALKTELDCKNNYKVSALEDLDSEISHIQNFINVFKDNKIKEL